MANLLKMAKIDAILSLHQRNWSIRRIAKELGIHRDTVARQIRLWEQDPKPARAPLGSAEEVTVCPEAKQATLPAGAPSSKQATCAEGVYGPKQATCTEGASDSKQATPEGAPIGSARPQAGKHRQASLCEPWRQVILDKLEAGLTAQRIYQELEDSYTQSVAVARAA